MSDGEYRPVRIRDARIVARILCEHAKVHAVELFGSIAQRETKKKLGEKIPDVLPKDIDLILIADEDDAQLFLKRCAKELEAPRKRAIETAEKLGREIEINYGHQTNRLRIAQEVLSPGFIQSTNRAQRAARLGYPGYLDLFVFPANWRDRLPELQTAIPHHDKHFMENIAQDAFMLCKKQN